jgi:hypothetical protein
MNRASFSSTGSSNSSTSGSLARTKPDGSPRAGNAELPFSITAQQMLSSGSLAQIAALSSPRAAVTELMNSAQSAEVTQMANNALIGFVKVIVDIQLSLKLGQLSEYKRHAKLKAAGWELTMGFGLHIGWCEMCKIFSISKSMVIFIKICVAF